MIRLLTAFFVLSMVAPAADPTGDYELTGMREMASGLRLSANGTFQYFFTYGAADYSSEGTWKVDGDAVVLNAKVTSAPPFRLVSSSATKEKDYRVVVKNAQGRAAANVHVLVKPKKGKVEEQQTDQEGVAMFPESMAPEGIAFEVRVYQLQTEMFPVKPGHNLFQFELNGEAITRVPFKDERLKIDGDKLELRYWNSEHAMTYRKQKQQ